MSAADYLNPIGDALQGAWDYVFNTTPPLPTLPEWSPTGTAGILQNPQQTQFQVSALPYVPTVEDLAGVGSGSTLDLSILAAATDPSQYTNPFSSFTPSFSVGSNSNVYPGILPGTTQGTFAGSQSLLSIRGSGSGNLGTVLLLGGAALVLLLLLGR